MNEHFPPVNNSYANHVCMSCWAAGACVRCAYSNWFYCIFYFWKVQAPISCQKEVNFEIEKYSRRYTSVYRHGIGCTMNVLHAKCWRAHLIQCAKNHFSWFKQENQYNLNSTMNLIFSAAHLMALYVGRDSRALHFHGDWGCGWNERGNRDVHNCIWTDVLSFSVSKRSDQVISIN